MFCGILNLMFPLISCTNDLVFCMSAFEKCSIVFFCFCFKMSTKFKLVFFFSVMVVVFNSFGTEEFSFLLVVVVMAVVGVAKSVKVVFFVVVAKLRAFALVLVVMVVGSISVFPLVIAGCSGSGGGGLGGDGVDVGGDSKLLSPTSSSLTSFFRFFVCVHGMLFCLLGDDGNRPKCSFQLAGETLNNHIF